MKFQISCNQFWKLLTPQLLQSLFALVFSLFLLQSERFILWWPADFSRWNVNILALFQGILLNSGLFLGLWPVEMTKIFPILWIHSIKFILSHLGQALGHVTLREAQLGVGTANEFSLLGIVFWIVTPISSFAKNTLTHNIFFILFFAWIQLPFLCYFRQIGSVELGSLLSDS